ncbi:MAG: DUF4382 domain-containing protein [Candidatus Aminicenantia bacterium]
MAILAIFILISCSLFKQTGNFQIYLKDTPVEDADNIYITINQVRVQKTETGFITVSETSRTYDLLKLREKQELLLDTSMDEGMYTQIRLSISSGEIVIEGESHQMVVPSEEVKIPIVFEIKGEEKTKIVLDFEAEHSILVTGTGVTKIYILRPVIRVESVS